MYVRYCPPKLCKINGLGEFYTGFTTFESEISGLGVRPVAQLMRDLENKKDKVMKPLLTQILAAAAATAMALPAVAQSTTFDNQDAASDAVDAIEDAVEDDFDRSFDRGSFGNQGRNVGWYGSLAGTANATSGNSDTTTVGIGTKFGFFDGTNGHDVRLSYSYGEDSGVTSTNSGLLGYDYTRNLNGDLFAYGKLTSSYDEFGAYTRDTFVGAGLGYRVVDNGQTTWTVQAGPGYRTAEDANGQEIEETAASITSKAAFRISDTTFMTNDTDILWSEANTLVTNDLGVNVKMTDSLALRTSLLTKYNTEPVAGFDDTDNSLGMSVVYTFN